MRLKNIKELAGEASVGLFLSLGIHTVLITGAILYKVFWPEFGKISSVELELVENRRAESVTAPVKVVSAISNTQEEETGKISSEPIRPEMPPAAKDAAAGTGNIQANEEEGAGSGNVPLPSNEGKDVLSIEGLSLDKRGLGNTEFSGGNGNAEGVGKGVFLATGLGGYNQGGGGMGDLPRLPFIPRQVLEVVPEKPAGGAEGEIDLILRIGTDGRVKEHRVNSNTTNSYIYLNNVIKAAYRSKWEAVTYKGGRVEYWIEKKYSFN